VLGEEIYYRVYAERHHVHLAGSQLLLFRTALRDLYGPYLFWLTTVPNASVAKELFEAIEAPKHPMILGAFRAIVLLGKDATVWLDAVLDDKYKGWSQPPEFYWTFKKMVARTNLADRRLIAMRTTGHAVLALPDPPEMKVLDLLAAPEEAAAQLSRICVRVFRGETSHRGLARQVDVAAYGRQIDEIGSAVWAELQRLASS
jgi:hypothetical protein